MNLKTFFKKCGGATMKKLKAKVCGGVSVAVIGFMLICGAAGDSDFGVEMANFLPRVAIGLFLFILGFFVAWDADKKMGD